MFCAAVHHLRNAFERSTLSSSHSKQFEGQQDVVEKYWVLLTVDRDLNPSSLRIDLRQVSSQSFIFLTGEVEIMTLLI